jgi:hypothetical protein
MIGVTYADFYNLDIECTTAGQFSGIQLGGCVNVNFYTLMSISATTYLQTSAINGTNYPTRFVNFIGPDYLTLTSDGTHQSISIIGGNVNTSLTTITSSPGNTVRWNDAALPVGFNVSTVQPSGPSPATVTNGTIYSVILYVTAAGLTTQWKISAANGSAATIVGSLTVGQTIRLNPGDSIIVSFNFNTPPSWVWYAD